MKWLAAGVLGVCCFLACAEQALKNPLGNVLILMRQMSVDVRKDADKDAKAYAKFTNWCHESASNSDLAVKAAAKRKSELEATITRLGSDIDLAGTRTEELASAIAEAEAQAKDAQKIREKENADFVAGEKEMMEMVDALERATHVLEKKGSAVLAQVDKTNMGNLVQALGTMLEAAAFPTSDRSKLLALVQSRQAAQDEDAEADAALGATQAAAYQPSSGNVVEVMEDMKDDAEAQLVKLRKAETEAKGNYDLLKQSLKDQVAEDKKDMDTQKRDKAKAKEDKAKAEGDLQMTTKALKDSQEELQTVQATCLQTAADHQKTAASRKAELEAIEKGIEILQQATQAAPSFVQVSATSTAGLSRSQVVTAVKSLAKKHHSAALAELASRIASVVASGASSRSDPFVKVKGMIRDMINKLNKQATNEAMEKEYCDRQIKVALAKEDDLKDDVATMRVSIDSAASEEATLKEEVKNLEGDLASVAREQAGLDNIRTETHQDYEMEKDDLKKGLQAVRQAVGVLRDYYGSDDEAAAMLQEDSDFDAFMQQPAPPEKHSKKSSAGSNLIILLEEIESNFANNLARLESQESDAQSDYTKVTRENKVTEATKETDVKYDERKIKSLDTTLAETSEDKQTTSSELSAVTEYELKLESRCIAKPGSYEQRAKRRTAEIKGLQEALRILATEAAAFLQRRRGRRGLRGHSRLGVSSTV